MNKNIFSYAVFMCLIVSQTSAQESAVKPSIEELYIQTGSFTERNAYGNLNDFKTLMPGSEILNDPIHQFSQYGGSTFSSMSQFSVAAGIKLKPWLAQRSGHGPMLRLGINYLSGQSLSHGAFKEDRGVFDTLKSGSSGQMMFIDSIRTQQYYMNYSSDQIRLDGSLIFRTNPARRWSFFAGVGLNAGVSINAQTEIRYSDLRRTESRFNDGTVAYHTSQIEILDQNYERERNKANLSASAYVPMGVDFRIGKKEGLLKQTHLFYEMRPGINATVVPELRTITSAGVQHGFGIRVTRA